MAANLVSKRQNLAANMVLQATALVNALTALGELKAQRVALSADFQDTDFETAVPVVVDGVSVRIDHLSAYAAGAILDFGLTPLNAAYTSGSPTPQSVLEQARQ